MEPMRSKPPARVTSPCYVTEIGREGIIRRWRLPDSTTISQPKPPSYVTEVGREGIIRRWRLPDSTTISQPQPSQEELFSRLDDLFYAEDPNFPGGKRRKVLPKGHFEEAIQKILELHGNLGTVTWVEYCMLRGIYHIYTTEFVDSLAEELKSLNADSGKPILEICAGDGTLSRELVARGSNMVAVDDKSWDGLNFGPNVIELDGLDAVREYEPWVVIGCWVPKGNEVDVNVLRYPTVRAYIHIGYKKDGITGSKKLWKEPGWKFKALRSVNQYALGPGDIRYHYTYPTSSLAYLFQRTNA